MGFPPLLNLSTRLSTAALPGQTTKMAQTLESMFQNVAYRPTVYRTGHIAKTLWAKVHAVPLFRDLEVQQITNFLRKIRERENFNTSFVKA